MRVSLELQPCCGNRTGIGVYTYELSKRLYPDSEIEYQGNVFNFAGRHNLSVLKNDLKYNIIENRSIPYGIYRRIWKMIPTHYESFFGKSDITHFFNYIVPPKVYGKVITTVHDMTYVRYPDTVSKVNMERLRRGIDYSVKRSSLIITGSEFSKNEIIDCLKIPPTMVEVVYPAANISRGLCSRESLFHRLGVCQPYLLFVGTIEPRKNLSRLIKAFDLLKKEERIKHQLVICGGNGWKNGSFYQVLEKTNCKDDICISGYLPDSEKNTLYANAAAFVFPSIYEGFGVPLLEAMYWKVPIISSNVASLPEVAGDAACYVSPFSVEEIAQGIYNVITNKNYSQSLVEKGILRNQMFSWDKSAERLRNLYLDLG